MAKGIGFYNIKDGRTNYAKSEAQIEAYINSSDMGINASRGQDFGWRLSKEWVEAEREFRKERGSMTLLASKNGGKAPSRKQILYAIYSRQLREENEVASQTANPYEEAYLQSISTAVPQAVPVVDKSEDTQAVPVKAKKPSSKKKQ